MEGEIQEELKTKKGNRHREVNNCECGMLEGLTERSGEVKRRADDGPLCTHHQSEKRPRERNRKTNTLRVTHWWEVIGGDMETGGGRKLMSSETISALFTGFHITAGLFPLSILFSSVRLPLITCIWVFRLSPSRLCIAEPFVSWCVGARLPGANHHAKHCERA